ncbi:3-ketoacyl-CoA thiolase, peroxisomal 2 [Seiridium cupressi]
MTVDFWPPAVWLLLGFVTAYVAAQWKSCKPLDSREPPIVTSRIPYLGHLLGMIIHGGRYVKSIGLRNRSTTIFTLVVPNSRIYIVTDPSLAAAVQRASKALSFTPIIPEVTERILGLDKATKEIAKRNLDPGPGEEKGFLAEIQEMTYSWLGPGDYLSNLILDAAQEMKHAIDHYRNLLELRPGPREPVNLLVWVQRLVTVSTANYLYGPKNPIALDSDLIQAFWDFDHGIGMLLVNMYPGITAPKAYRGREKLVAALAKYLEAGTYTTGSKIIQERIKIALRHGWTLQTAAREELSFLFAGIVNATTSTFWILLHIFADSNLRTRVRSEIEGSLSQYHKSGTTTLGINDLKNKCPWLVAVYRECLRLNSDNNSIRIVKEPTILADRYYLAKDSVVQIAGGVIHADQSIWGSNVDEFDPSRFLGRGTGTSKEKEKQFHPAAFRAFGGGKTLCPGRHFAMAEILSLVAMTALYFDMEAPDGGNIKCHPTASRHIEPSWSNTEWSSVVFPILPSSALDVVSHLPNALAIVHTPFTPRPTVFTPEYRHVGSGVSAEPARWRKSQPPQTCDATLKAPALARLNMCFWGLMSAATGMFELKFRGPVWGGKGKYMGHSTDSTDKMGAVDRLQQISSQVSGSKSAKERLLIKSPDDIVVTGCLRTAFTKGGKGGFKDTAAADLMAGALKGLIQRSKIDPALVEDVCVGEVLAPGGGATEMRAAALVAGFPESTAVRTLNRQCSSGLQACVDVANQIKTGMIEIGIGAGVESMSTQYGPAAVSEFSELLELHPESANCKVPMGVLSEQMAADRNIKRADQDAFAASSYQKAAKAQEAGLFDEEIHPLTVKYEDPKSGETKTITVAKDDGVRPGVTKESLGKMKGAFAQGGSIHAGNASQISDGAAAVLMMKRSTAEKLGQTILGKYVAASIVGVKPLLMGIGPWKAIPKVFEKAGITKDDVDIFEINEAFASQCLWCANELGLDYEKINPKGGAIAFGHPLGCTGARQVSTLLYELRRRGEKVGVTSMCIGTGMGMAAVWVAE